MKNTDIDFQDDVIEYNEIDRAQSIAPQSIDKPKEEVSNQVVRTRFIITLAVLFVLVLALILISEL